VPLASAPRSKAKKESLVVVQGKVVIMLKRSVRAADQRYSGCLQRRDTRHLMWLLSVRKPAGVKCISGLKQFRKCRASRGVTSEMVSWHGRGGRARSGRSARGRELLRERAGWRRVERCSAKCAESCLQLCIDPSCRPSLKISNEVGEVDPLIDEDRGETRGEFLLKAYLEQTFNLSLDFGQ